MDNIKIGKLIAKRRKQKGLTQSQLAEYLGVSNKTVSKWETGGGLPDISLLIDLADALSITIDDLLKGHDISKKSFDFDRSFIMKKRYYRQYVTDQYFNNHLYWMIDLIALLLILGGMAALPLQLYLSAYVAIFAKLCLLFGFVLLLIPLFISCYHVISFHPLEVSYALKNDKLVYLCNGEETIYDLQQFSSVEKKKFAYLKKDKKVIWIEHDDLHEIKQYMQNESVKITQFKLIGQMFLALTAICTLVLQLGYQIVLKNFGFEYIHDQYEILFYIIIIWSIFGLWIIIKKSGKQFLIYMVSSVVIIFLINIYLKASSSIQVIDSFSPDFHRAVLKYDSFHEDLNNYHYTYLCFAKKTDTVHVPKMISNKGYWLTDDCYILTYQDLHQKQDVYVSTFGDRGNGISYYYVTAVLQGNWYQNINDKNPFRVKVENGEITVKHNDTSVFSGKEIQQNGTIAITLYENDHPRYVIALDENCYLEDDGLINAKGTITVFDFDDFSSATLYCGTHKEDQEVSEKIDDELRDSMIRKVNEMNQILLDDPQLKYVQNSYDLFKVKTDSDDYFDVSKAAYQMHLSLYTDTSMLEKCQIKNIRIIAGDIKDFYVELNVEETVKGQGETVTGMVGSHYRIKRGKGGYLVANVTYSLPGSVGLKPNDPVIEKDTANDSDYAFTLFREG